MKERIKFFLKSRLDKAEEEMKELEKTRNSIYGQVRHYRQNLLSNKGFNSKDELTKELTLKVQRVSVLRDIIEKVSE